MAERSLHGRIHGVFWKGFPNPDRPPVTKNVPPISGSDSKLPDQSFKA